MAAMLLSTTLLGAATALSAPSATVDETVIDLGPPPALPPFHISTALGDNMVLLQSVGGSFSTQTSHR